ncbi:MAG: hypothetical protein FJ319_12910 [SAR202 cluster bacterium]|nr:hypothetical protein [SAR202 cluster bacterium]
MMRRPKGREKVTPVLIMGSAGRDFHNFNMVFRDNPDYRVMAFISSAGHANGIDQYPPSLAGALYSGGIPVYPEVELEDIISQHNVEFVFFSYSDVPHLEVMHQASRVLAAGANFSLLGPRQTMLAARVPVVSVTAVRAGAGKGPVSSRVAAWMKDRGHRVAVVTLPKRYLDLEKQAAQVISGTQDMASAAVSPEERDEYEPYIAMGVPVCVGVDYGIVLRVAEKDSDVIVWDGGENDFPFTQSDLRLVVVDPHHAGEESTFHPGEVNFRMADAFIVPKVGTATSTQLSAVQEKARNVRPNAPVIMSEIASGRGKGGDMKERSDKLVNLLEQFEKRSLIQPPH